MRTSRARWRRRYLRRRRGSAAVVAAAHGERAARALRRPHQTNSRGPRGQLDLVLGVGVQQLRGQRPVRLKYLRMDTGNQVETNTSVSCVQIKRREYCKIRMEVTSIAVL